jgi:acetolactate synthase-1/2/3 large subunit
MDKPIKSEQTTESVAEAYLSLLASRGVDYIFGNAGTDFPPLIEAFAKARSGNRRFPKPVLVPHENVAVAMAHGFTMVTGRMQAVMVHVGLGTANALNGIVNAARQNVPMFFAAGRTPIAEGGLLGSRNNYINWAQEMFDQASMVREFVKWEYELRHAIQLETVIDRAFALAKSEPQGPVYLTLPREVLAGEMNGYACQSETTIAPTTPPQPDRAALAEVAALLAQSERPVLITSNAGREAAGVEALIRLAETATLGVVQYRPRYMCIPTDHPMHCGYDATKLLNDADLVLVVDCDVPWIPDQVKLRKNCKVVHIGNDPLFARYPIRGFRADIALVSQVAPALQSLADLMRDAKGNAQAVKRRQYIDAYRAKTGGSMPQKDQKIPGVITPKWVSTCIQNAKDDDTIVINEYPLVLEEVAFSKPMTYFAHAPSGGLGWAMGAALGVRLAKPEATVIVAVGDGTYMFGNPTPTHFVSRAADLPTVTVVFNNARWAAVHRATLSMYPDGYAARDNMPEFTCLEPSPDYEKLVEACGGYGEKVTDPAELPAALQRALHAVRVEKRQAVLNVICAPVYVRTS